MSSIYKAIEYLPDELITNEIAEAAIEEGKAELFNTLPKRFLTSDVILSIIQKGNENHSWDSFDLSNIPLELRCDKVCEYAIAKDDDNIIHTPLELLSSTMLSKLLKSTEKNLKYLHLFGEEQWRTEHLIRGVANIYSKTYSSSGYSRGYYGNRTVNDIKPVLIFLSYAPSKVKDKKFYTGLFNTSIAINDINKLTPKRYKGKEYWVNVAKHDFDIIPEQYYNIITYLNSQR